MAEILCPYCFKKFKTAEVMLQCQNDSTQLKPNESGDFVKVPVCPSEEDVKYSNHWGARKLTKHIFSPNFGFLERMGWKNIQGKPCDKCHSVSQRFVCPHCHNWLPTEMIEKGSQIVSVIGGPQSGKSNYIVALIHQLMKYRNKLGLTITLQQVGPEKKDHTDILYNSMKKWIFDDHMAVEKTQVRANQQPIPWIIRLESTTTKKAIYLVFYDTAGERFDNQNTVQDLKYFQESEACIVVFDTLAIPRIKKILAAKEIDTTGEAYNYGDTWTTLKGFVENNKHLKLTQKPFAFTFTKFDVVIDNQEALNCDVSDFTDDNGKFTNSSFIKTGTFSLKQVDAASKSIADYLHADDVWDEDALAADIENKWGDNGHFFGVSALGAMTDAVGKIQTEEVAPVRVMDPLVWILHKLGGFGIPLEGGK